MGYYLAGSCGKERVQTLAPSAVKVGSARLYRFPVEYWEMARSLAHPDTAFTNPSAP